MNAFDTPGRRHLRELTFSEEAWAELDAAGQPFYDREADSALFDALEQTLRQTPSRRLSRLPHHINDPEFSAALVEQFRAIATP